MVWLQYKMFLRVTADSDVDESMQAAFDWQWESYLAFFCVFLTPA